MNPTTKKPEYTFEKQYSSVIELKTQIQKAIEFNMAYLSINLSSKSLEASHHFDQFLSTIENNTASIHSNIIALNKGLSQKMKNRIEKFHSLQNMYLDALQKSKLLIKGKNKYKECNLMKKSEMVSIQYEISQLTNKIKIIQMQSNTLENEIANLKKNNKNSYTTEISLLEQVMSFDKRLYTVFNAREGLLQQRQLVQNEINQKDVQIKKRITAQTQIKIKTITKKINESNNTFNYIFPIQRSWNLKFNEFNVLEKELNNYYSIFITKGDDSKIKEQSKMTTLLLNDDAKVNQMLMQLISNSRNQFDFVLKIMPPSNSKFLDEVSQDPFALMNMIVNAIKKYISDKQSQELNVNKQIESSRAKIKQMEMNICLTVYRKMKTKKIMNALKNNYINNKEEQKMFKAEIIEKERLKKISQIKQKEAQLIKELELQKEKEKETLRLMEMRKEKTEKVEKKIKKGKKEKGKDQENNNDEEQDRVNIKNIVIPQVLTKEIQKPFINEIEKSFQSSHSEQINFANLNFIDELSKNIQEVHNFHQKSVFGDKKNKYSKYGFL